MQKKITDIIAKINSEWGLVTIEAEGHELAYKIATWANAPMVGIFTIGSGKIERIGLINLPQNRTQLSQRIAWLVAKAKDTKLFPAEVVEIKVLEAISWHLEYDRLPEHMEVQGHLGVNVYITKCELEREGFRTALHFETMSMIRGDIAGAPSVTRADFSEFFILTEGDGGSFLLPCDLDEATARVGVLNSYRESGKISSVEALEFVFLSRLTYRIAKQSVPLEYCEVVA